MARTRRTLAVGLIAFAAFGGAADARMSPKKAIFGPPEVNGVSQFPIYRDLGVGTYHSGINWSQSARDRPANPRDPNDPAYRWPTYLDVAVREAARYRIHVMVNITHAPAWSNGGREPRFSPTDPNDYADFAEAAARRYPTVHLWMVWGEPSRGTNFQPNAPNSRTGPRAYARILDAAYARLKRLSRRNMVLGGNTFPAGDVLPLRWLSYMRLPNGRPPRLDYYGHNPFAPHRPDLKSPPLQPGYVDWGQLDTLADRIDRVYPPRRRRGRRPVQLYLAEYTVQTGRPSATFNFATDERTAASWLKDALRIVSRWDRIRTIGWFELYDDAPLPEGNEAQLGLLAADGRRKPAYYAFRRG